VEPGDPIRLQIVLHYDGSSFHGWQLQPDQRTVQGEVQAALARLTGEERTVMGSGRTDAGVHATGQVASFLVPARWDAAEMHRALNAVLPRDIWVQAVCRVDTSFHPRFHARRRRYRYRVATDPAGDSPFHRRWCWSLGESLDRTLLDQAAALLSGTRSFQAFAKAGQPERGYTCTVHEAAWSEWPLGMAFSITANRYLHHMVRYLTGTMVAVARGRRPLDDFRGLLENEDGLETSPPAPPQGLFLAHVEYRDGPGRSAWSGSPVPAPPTPTT